jgi:hypothetical protein
VSLRSVLDVLAERGLSLVLGADGQPRVKGDPEEVTPALLEALKAYRPEIVARLTPKPAREWLWPTGHRYRERPGDGWPDTHHASGAWWWRLEGETTWRLVPGRNPEGRPPPEGKADA